MGRTNRLWGGNGGGLRCGGNGEGGGDGGVAWLLEGRCGRGLMDGLEGRINLLFVGVERREDGRI